MSLKKRVYSVLVVSSAENFNATLPTLLPNAIYRPVMRADSVAAAQRKMNERSYDLILINAPLPDDYGTRFAIDSSTGGSAVVLMIVKADLYADIYDKVAEYGVFVLPKPSSRQAVLTALRWMITAKERIRRYEIKSTSIEEKMREIRLVNRAKWLLIEREGMSEQDAHRYVEKLAMDRCVTKGEIAQDIVEKYEPSA